jgi:hypothetical protein
VPSANAECSQTNVDSFSELTPAAGNVAAFDFTELGKSRRQLCDESYANSAAAGRGLMLPITPLRHLASVRWN